MNIRGTARTRDNIKCAVLDRIEVSVLVIRRRSHHHAGFRLEKARCAEHVAKTAIRQSVFAKNHGNRLTSQDRFGFDNGGGTDGLKPPLAENTCNSSASVEACSSNQNLPKSSHVSLLYAGPP